MAYQSWSVVYGEQPSAAKWNILGTNDAHFYSFTGDNVAYQSFTPTFNNFTLGNGTATGFYNVMGKRVNGEIYVVAGNTTAFGTASSFDPPVAINTRYTSRRFTPTGNAIFHDNGTEIYFGSLFFDSSTASGKILMNAFSTAGGTFVKRATTTATSPYTIAANDTLSFTFDYERS